MAQEDIRENVIVAYQEIMNKFKTGNAEKKPSHSSVEDELSEFETEFSREGLEREMSAEEMTTGGMSRNIAELRLNMAKALDDIILKMNAEQKKFEWFQQKKSQMESELERIAEARFAIHQLSSMIVAVNEKAIAMEQELTEFRHRIEGEKMQIERDRIREQNDYVQKRDAERRRDLEEYEIEKRSLYEELYEKHRLYDEKYAARKAGVTTMEEE